MTRTSIGMAFSLLLLACGADPQVGTGQVREDEAARAVATPGNAIQLISSFPEQGSSSHTARIIAPRIEEHFGRPVQIRYNRGGRGGDIGARAAAEASPDDLTLFVGTVGNIALLPSILPGYAVDPLRDFRAVTQLTVTPDVLVAHAGLGVGSLPELLAYAEARAEPLSYSHIAPFSIHRMEFLEVLRALGIAARNDASVRGSAAAMAAVADGTIDLAMTTAPYVAPLVEAGAVVPLAVANESRIPGLPDVPTMTESGIDIPHGSWAGAFVPAATSEADTEEMFLAISAALRDPAVASAIAKLGMVAAPSASPAEFTAYIRRETARLGRVADDFHVRED